jgi:hypothetical protein
MTIVIIGLHRFEHGRVAENVDLVGQPGGADAGRLPR